MNRITLVNGKKQSKLSVTNRLTQFGDGLFETCLVVNGKLLLAKQHFDRLNKGAQRLQITPIDQSIWLKDISKAMSKVKFDRAVVKMILSRGETERGYGFDDTIEPVRIVTISKAPDLPADLNLNLCKSGYADNQLLAEIKHCNRLEQVLARRQMSAQECIMLDPQGQIISASQGNIFAVKNGVLLTPGLNECGIEGTRRQLVLELAGQLNMSVEVCTLTMAELLECDEIFVTNSVMGIMPIRQVNEQIFAERTTTKKLNNAFKQAILKRQYSIDLTSKRYFSKFLSLIILGLLLFWLYWANTINTVKIITYQVPQGAGIYSVAQDLKRHGLVNSSLFVIWAFKLSNADRQLKSGFYDIHPQTSVWQLLADIKSNQVATRNISLIEGKTLRDYHQLLRDNQSIAVEDSLDKTLVKTAVKPPYEGQFWPDTYQVNYGDSAVSVLDRAHAILDRKLTQAWNGRDEKHLLTDKYQALTLASLIERETAVDAEKAKISGVFINRLKKNMRLQTDPTVVYALGEAYTGKLTKQDLWVKSPYNTYRNKGLPPSPISSVGQASLEAAMHPLQTDYLFFVAKKDGTHAFAKTYKQHLINIKKHLK
ncbi:MAG: endolytic transglycosylase MltG [Candidatus Thioglobus sp.]|nr:endolytic transglycosylase MltG [Candidatus Thioglobus pontius]MBL6976974.1 endolytic transglycosylase MltG [Candidatus Thioglobus sp.]MBL6984750.1 endolytic transglycosylase MltG [Candidatus Thioglobus sp.]